MIIVLVKWYIWNDRVENFLQFWKEQAKIDDRSGLVAEYLSKPEDPESFPWITWVEEVSSVASVFMNTAIWSDEASFEDQIARYFNDAAPIKDFEHSRRVRMLLRPHAWRVGRAGLSKSDSDGVM